MSLSRSWFVRWAALLAAGVSAALGCSGGGTPARSSSNRARPTPASNPIPVQFSVRADRVITRDFVGFGGQMNPYLWCRPNAGIVTEQNVGELEQKIIDLAPQHVRIFLLPQWWDGRADDVSRGDPRTKDSFLRTAALAQRAGASINLTLWYGPYPNPQRTGERFAEILDELIRTRGLSAIRYATIQNEPNGAGHKITLELYNRLYHGLDAGLRQRGLREHVRIIGGDLVALNQEQWFQNLATHLAGICDGYSTHIYWDYWDQPKLLRRLREVAQIVGALAPAERKPLYVTEFGARGRRQRRGDDAGLHASGKPVAATIDGALQIARFNLEALNLGYVATVQWDLYDADYNVPMRYGTIGDVTTGWPLRPTYWLLMVMTHTCRPGWEVLGSEGQDEGVFLAAMRGPAGEFTVYVLNQSTQTQSVFIKGLPASRGLSRMIWNNDGAGRLSAVQGIETDGTGAAAVTIPPQSVTALTTLNWHPPQ